MQLVYAKLYLMRSRLPTILIILFLFTFRVGSALNTAFQNNIDSGKAHIPTIRSATNLVLVPVSVTDSAGRPVKNLRLEDFVVLDNGRSVMLQNLGEPELTRLEIILLFDITSSVWFHFDIVRESAAGFVKSIFQGTPYPLSAYRPRRRSCWNELNRLPLRLMG